MTGIEEFIKTYGTFAGLALYILVKEIWPYLRDKYWPQKQMLEHERAMQIREQEKRITDTLEKIGDAIGILAKEVSIQNERIGNQTQRVSDLTSMTIEHISVTNAAITAMLVKTNTAMPIRPPASSPADTQKLKPIRKPKRKQNDRKESGSS